MAFSAATGSAGESISHFTSVRMRIVGQGNLDMKFVGMDGVLEQELEPFVMASNPGREPLRLANFQNQRAMFEFSTDEIDELFKINRIVLFGTYLWNEFPG